MRMQVDIGERKYCVELDQAVAISISLDFDRSQPSHFGADPASRQPMTGDGFEGRVQSGRGCNVDVLTINPHCNGTHTETVGHIVEEPVHVSEVASTSLFPACVLTVEPELASQQNETYRPSLAESDEVITKVQIEQAIQPWIALGTKIFDALVIRTLPNGNEKRFRNYGNETVPAFLTIEATNFLNELGISHLVVDLPSIDRMHDEGRLTNHHIFWNVAEETSKLVNQTWSEKTITEMVYVPDHLEDGVYLLNLQFPAFCSDAAPAKPVLYPLTQVKDD